MRNEVSPFGNGLTFSEGYASPDFSTALLRRFGRSDMINIGQYDIIKRLRCAGFRPVYRHSP